MSRNITDQTAAQAMKSLASRDLALAPLITQFGLCPIRQHTDYYQALVESIIGQQLSVKAAASIRRRFINLFGGSFPSPQQIVDTTIEDMRAVGFSRAKAAYVHDLAQRILNNKIDFSRFDRLSNQSITAELTAVKGIGEWTAHMFLMFCMARSDVLPTGDLGIRSGIKKLYNLSELPDKATVVSIATRQHWRPYESIASWYIWQSLDNTPTNT